MARRADRLKAATLGAFLLTLLSPALAIEVPPGFEDTIAAQVLAVGSFDWAPDGALWMSQHTTGMEGRVWVQREGFVTLALTLSTNEEGERGIHTLRVDPDYATNHRIWLYYTHSSEVNRLSHFTDAGDTLVDEVVVLEGPPLTDIRHNGGCFVFAADKTILLGMGDDGMPVGSGSPSDPFSILGKVLHLDRQGNAVESNPYFDGSQGDPRVWALGFRNPFRCTLQAGTENLFVSDVGSFRFEEIGIALRGAHHGWSIIEGVEPSGQPGFVYPIHVYPGRLPDGTGAAIIGGAHVAPGQLHPDYAGDYFFADYMRNEIYRLKLDERHNPVFVQTWATGVLRTSEVRIGPDGALYYTNRAGLGGTQGVHRIGWVGGGNEQPVAVVAVSPDSGAAPLEAVFDGAASSDPDADGLTYSWDFGDGNLGSGAVVQHSYASGVYEAVLTVDDGNGLAADSPPVRVVSGNKRPLAAITAPLDTSAYNAGQTIAFSGTGTDIEEGGLPCSAFTWQVLRYTDGLVRPVLGPEQGSCGGTFDALQTGQHSPDAFYEIVQRVTDSGVPLGAEGTLEAEDAVRIYPNTTELTFQTLPRNGLSVTLDATELVAPATVQSVVSFVRRLGAVDGQLLDGHTYTWDSWSDAGTLEHDIVTPSAPSVLTATFACDVIVEVDNLKVVRGAGDQLELSWDVVSDPCLGSGAQRYQVYAGATPVPAVAPGEFGLDPPFDPVGSSAMESLAFTPGAGDTYFLVVGIGTDLAAGPAGHY